MRTSSNAQITRRVTAEFSPLTEPAGPYQSVGISQSLSIRERVWKQRYAFVYRYSKLGQNAGHLDAFLSQAKTFCIGKERTGTERSGFDGTERRTKNIDLNKLSYLHKPYMKKRV